MKTIGLTGGIGSGKSVIAHLWKTMGFPVYDSDSEAKKITSTSSLIRERLVERFGKEVYKKDELNKKFLASLIFNNEENLNFVNAIIHPEVRENFVRWKEQHSDSALTVIESAILFESGFGKEVDVCISVAAPLELRIERIQKREKISRESILNRIQVQMPDAEREKKADYIIFNDNKQAILPQVENILSKLLKISR